ncbi:MAG: SpoIIE family protein phosphatase [Spirochaetes bacterium]|nr:SpoIIE family protein phosphatase [Spirochaetota bacterium]
MNEIFEEGKIIDLKILICEDDSIARSLLLNILKRKFEIIIEAENGKIGLEKYKLEKPDLIISDINMPELNGIEFATEIRKEDKKTPIIFLTAYSDTSYFINSIELGINGYVLKPVVKDSLFNVLQKVISNLKLERKIEEQRKKIEELYNQLNFELDIASKIHQSLLPQHKIQNEHYLFEFIYKPLEQIGGDFFEIININENETLIFLTDVTGHGVPAALFSAMFKANLYYIIKNDISPQKILNSLNLDLPKILPSDFFPSFFIAIFNKKEKILRYSNSAHPSPIIYNISNNTYKILKEKDPFLGIDKNYNFSEKKIFLNKNDILFIYTDGLYEFENKNGEIIQEEEFYEIFINYLNNYNFDEKEKLLENFVNYMLSLSKENKFSDDFSLLKFEII